MAILPWIVGTLAVTVWHLRTAIPKSHAKANRTGVGGFPEPFDAKQWDELTSTNPSVRNALVFWSNLNRLEPDFLLPTWIELTGAEQKMVIDGFTSGDDSRLRQVVQLSLRRAEPRREDAEMRHTISQLVDSAKRA
jgi:hypothetical protein